MPGKGRRVASRQAQVGRKRRRQVRGPTGVPVAGFGTAVAEPEESTTGVAPAAEASTFASTIRKPQAQAAAPSNARSPARVRGDRPAAHNYVKAELLRILSMAGALTAVLILISFFL